MAVLQYTFFYVLKNCFIDLFEIGNQLWACFIIFHKRIKGNVEESCNI